MSTDSVPTLTLHHLDNSRSQRVIWLLEELDVPYTIKSYKRTPEQRAPDTLKAIHPLGKSPIITDGETTLAETGAIIEYILFKYDKEGKFNPSEAGWAVNKYYTHFCEGTFMANSTFSYVMQLAPESMPLLVKPVGRKITAEIQARMPEAALKDALDMIEAHLAKQPEGANFAGGTNFTSADFMMIFPLETSLVRRPTAVGPKTRAWVQKIQQLPTYKKSLEKGGPYKFAA